MPNKYDKLKIQAFHDAEWDTVDWMLDMGINPNGELAISDALRRLAKASDDVFEGDYYAEMLRLVRTTPDGSADLLVICQIDC